VDQKTHREVKVPQISVRQLADYMAASERGKRAIVRNCKYQPLARLIQHEEARKTVSDFLRSGSKDAAVLHSAAQKLRDRLASDPFERDVFDHNADYIDQFAMSFHGVSFPPGAEVLPAKKLVPLVLYDVRVPLHASLLLRRITKTNKVRTGAVMLRYAKGKPLDKSVALYQSAIMLGVLKASKAEDSSEPEGALCLTLDAYAGTLYSAPTDAVTRFQNAKAALETISEQWPGIKPPKGAIL